MTTPPPAPQPLSPEEEQRQRGLYHGPATQLVQQLFATIDAARTERNEAQTKWVDLREDYHERTVERDALRLALAETESERLAAREGWERTKRVLDVAEREWDRLKSELTAATERAERAEAERESEKSQLTELAFKYETVVRDRFCAKSDLETTQKILQDARDDIARMIGEYRQIESDRDAARREVAEMREALTYVRDYAKRCSGDDSRLDEIVDHADIALERGKDGAR